MKKIIPFVVAAILSAVIIASCKKSDSDNADANYTCHCVTKTRTYDVETSGTKQDATDFCSSQQNEAQVADPTAKCTIE